MCNFFRIHKPFFGKLFPGKLSINNFNFSIITTSVNQPVPLVRRQRNGCTSRWFTDVVFSGEQIDLRDGSRYSKAMPFIHKVTSNARWLMAIKKAQAKAELFR